MDAEWEHGRTSARLARALKPLALVVAGVLAGVVALPSSSAPSFPIHVQPTAAPVPQRFEPLDEIAAGAWVPMAGGPLSSRERVVSAWTGDELLVWGGRVAAKGRWFGDGAAYDPRTDTWRELPASPLRPRGGAGGVWTGRELFVWGGAGSASDPVAGRAVATGQTTAAFADGALYDPTADRWRRVARAPLSPRRDPVVVWTGRHVVVWGGLAPTGARQLADGARYDPVEDRWQAMSSGPLSRGVALVVATPLEGRVIFWGSAVGATVSAVYDPRRDVWDELDAPRLQPGVVPAMTTVGGSALLWGGWRSNELTAVAVRYTMATRRWITIARPPYTPASRQPLVAAGGAAIAWHGGRGTVYDVVRGTWQPLPERRALRAGTVQAWTGERLLVWSPQGRPNQPTRATAWVRGNPWRPLENAPTAVDAAGAAVWTGWLEGDQELVLWGGLDHGSPDVGAAYDPAIGLWEGLPTAPLTRRVRPAAVWTGREVVVFGGSDLPGAPPLRDGAAFDPHARTWRTLPTTPFGVGDGGVASTASGLIAAGVRDGRAVVAQYSPRRHRWRELPPPPMPHGLQDVIVVWTDFEVWLWGTRADGPGAGAAWDPDDRRWRRLPSLPGVSGPLTTAWSVRRLFAIAHDGATMTLGRGGQQWQRYPRSPARGPGIGIAFNGQALVAFDAQRRRVAALDPEARTWIDQQPPPLPAAPDARLVWTGRDMFAVAGGAVAVLAR